MTSSPRPAGDIGIVRIIGAATLVGGRHVINCWETWMGGFEIVARYETNDPQQVRYAAEWAVRNKAYWEAWGRPGCPGFPVQSIEQVAKTFIH